MNQGWIKLHRSMLEWEWFQDINVFRLFTYCLLRANHADNKWRGIAIPRGSFVTGRTDLATKTGLTEQQIRTAINKLKSTGEVTAKATSKGTLLSICNYEAYQSQESQGNQQSNQQVNQTATSDQPDGNQIVTTNKKEKKEKKKNLDSAASDDAKGKPCDFYLTKKKRKLQGQRLDAFNRFWLAFGWMKGKADAADAWLDIPELRTTLVDHICASAEKANKEREATIAKGSTPQYAQGWITGRRWEDFDVAPSKPAPKRHEQAPHNWEAAMLKYFTDGGFTGALAQHKAGGFRNWDDIPKEDRPKIREVAHQIERKAEGE